MEYESYILKRDTKFEEFLDAIKERGNKIQKNMNEEIEIGKSKHQCEKNKSLGDNQLTQNEVIAVRIYTSFVFFHFFFFFIFLSAHTK